MAKINEDPLIEASYEVFKNILKLGDQEKSLEKVDVKKIYNLLKRWRDNLPKDQLEWTLVLLLADGRKLEIKNKDIPEEFKRNPEFRRYYLKFLASFGRFLHKKGFFNIGLGNPAPKPINSGEKVITEPKEPKPKYDCPNVTGYKGKILITSPYGDGWDDKACYIGGDFMKELYEWGVKCGLPVELWEGKQVVKSNWDKAVKSKDYIFISHLGHGNYNMITGWKLKILEWTRTLKKDFYKGLGASFLSCEMGKILLHQMVKIGGLIAGDGYTEVFAFYYRNTDPPRADEIAGSFLRTHLNTTYRMLQGYLFRDAFRDTNKLYEAWIEWWLMLGYSSVALVMSHDLDVHVKYGDDFFVIADKDRVETEIDADIKVDVKNIRFYRRLTALIEGKVKIKGTNQLVTSGQVLIRIGRWSTTIDVKDGTFKTIFEKTYPLDDIHEEVELYYNGGTDKLRVFLPSETKKEINVPFKAEETRIIVTDYKAEKYGFPWLRFKATGKVVGNETGEVPDAQVAMWAKLPAYGLGWSEIGFTDKEGVFRIAKIGRIGSIFKAILIWLFGTDVELGFEFPGDPSHKRTKTTVKTKIKGIF